jgi:SulP family sulfate permease
MVIGVSVGMVLAAFLFMRRMAEVTDVHLSDEGRPDTLGALPRGVITYEISGPLFFGAAQKAMAALEIVAGETRAVVLLMQGVDVMDTTGLVALESALAPLRAHKCLAILCGVLGQPLELVERARLDVRLGVVLCSTATEAFELASRHVGAPSSLAPEVSNPALEVQG